MKLLILLAAVISLSFHHAAQLAHFKATSIKCSYDNQTIDDMNCKIKAVRGRYGLVTFVAYPKAPINDIYVQFKIFYKLMVYQPFMVDVDVDMCKMINGSLPNGKNSFMNYFYPALKKFQPEIPENCPITRGMGLFDVDFDKVLSDALPQLLPNGDYRFLFRFHKRNNDTYATLMVDLSIVAIDKTSGFTMG